MVAYFDVTDASAEAKLFGNRAWRFKTGFEKPGGFWLIDNTPDKWPVVMSAAHHTISNLKMEQMNGHSDILNFR